MQKNEWTAEQEKQLADLFDQGLDNAKIASLIGRSATAVRVKAKRLKLVKAARTPLKSAHQVTPQAAPQVAPEAQMALPISEEPKVAPAEPVAAPEAPVAPNIPAEAPAAPVTPLAARFHTREEWLEAAVECLRGRFEKSGHPLPAKIRVSCGWPSSRGLGKKVVLGEAWQPAASEDNVPQIFITPRISDPLVFHDSPMGIMPTLAHELCHTLFGPEEHHGKNFKKAARDIGLEGPATSTTGGEEFMRCAKVWTRELGLFPHSMLSPLMRPTKKQTTRMVKMTCPDCGYIARTTKKWLEEKGAVICACNHKPMTFELPEDDGGEEGDGE